jgi:CxxC motif-containing protein
MSQQIITCINCPVGCRMTVTVEDGQVIEVKDMQCKRGDVYARQESIRPLRMVTAVAPVKGSATPISLKTAAPIPKDKIAACMRAVSALDLSLPISLGQVLLEDVAGTGIALVATRSLP